MIERLENHREQLPAISLEFARAREMALLNRNGIDDAIAAKQGLPKNREQTGWTWRPLLPRDGKTLYPDIFIKGILPADFDRHDALLLGFSWKDAQWYQKTLIDITAATWRYIQVIILVPDAVAQRLLSDELQQAKVPVDGIRFWQIPIDTAWIRDYGPFVIETADYGLRWVDATYRPDRIHDERVPTGLAHMLQTAEARTPMHLSGGNLLCNGQGLCLATENLLRRNAGLGYDENQVTATIRRLFGAREVIYLEALSEERTGDVDWFATFISPDTIVVGDYSGIDFENAAILDRNASRLRTVVTPSGPLRVERIPMPPRGRDVFGGTYTNVVFANRVLLVPTWANADPETEKQALDTFRQLMPDWKVVGIDAGHLGLREGGLRCATRQLYRVPF